MIWRLEGTALTATDAPFDGFGPYEYLVKSGETLSAVFLGYDQGASLWPETYRRRWCATIPELELTPNARPSGCMASFGKVTIVSGALRRVLDDAGCDILYGSVRGGPGPWLSMWPQVFADPFDHERTPGTMVGCGLPDGFTRPMWQPVLDLTAPTPLHYRDFEAPPLFISSVFGEVFVSDHLAEVLLRSGLTGLELLDVTSERGQRERVTKTL